MKSHVRRKTVHFFSFFSFLFSSATLAVIKRKAALLFVVCCAGSGDVKKEFDVVCTGAKAV